MQETIAAQVGTLLQVGRIDKVWLPDSGKWTIMPSQSERSDSDTDGHDKYSEWAEHAFLVRQKVKQCRGNSAPEITTKFLIRSDFLRRALRDVMKDALGISRNASILKLCPHLLLAFLPRMISFAEGEAGTAKEHITFLIEFLRLEYAATLHKIHHLVCHSEITFALLWAILVPGDLIFMRWETTGDPRIFRLRNIQQGCDRSSGKAFWRLACEYLEAADAPLTPGQQFGLAMYIINLEEFDGVKKIAELAAYPIKYHAYQDEIMQKLVYRGRKWAKLYGVHHKQYSGLAYRDSRRVWVNSRIMLDRRTFAKAEPNYPRPTPRRHLSGELWYMSELAPKSTRHPSQCVHSEDLEDYDVVLATPIVYGFSFTDKRWFEFNVECVTDIEWNDQGFENLAIDPDRRMLVQALVRSHTNSKQTRSVDDFVTGKGVGLVINLFGPPGVGKTLTVEATSEHLRKPLYIVSAGDLGTTPSHLDAQLTKIFSLAPVWDAIVLIDEADVFLQERGTADVERNAMVAVFLRQLEYFQGIMFLTTNRVKQFDPAFQSRIHLSLHYDDLSGSQKETLWRAFLEKTRTVGLGLCDFSTEQLEMLSQKKLNGRQIKNIVKLAVALAGEEETPLTYTHIVRTMGATDEWGSDYTTNANGMGNVLNNILARIRALEQTPRVTVDTLADTVRVLSGSVIPASGSASGADAALLVPHELNENGKRRRNEDDAGNTAKRGSSPASLL